MQLRLPFALILCLPILAICKARPIENSSTKEAWDAQNAPEIFGVKSVRYVDLTDVNALEGQTENKPWVDDYWPLSKKSMARRYSQAEDFETFQKQIENAKGSNFLSYLSPAEKYDILLDDPRWRLTQESWDTFTNLDRSYREKFAAKYPNRDKDLIQKKEFEEEVKNHWAWMGICHGWATASYKELPPANHVVTRSVSGKSILFFEGDIRGLMSKAYATNSFSLPQRFMGSRCQLQAETIVKDQYGRPVDGAFGTMSSEGKFVANKDDYFYIDKDEWSSLGVLTVRQDLSSNGKPFWLASKMRAHPQGAITGNFDLFRYESMDVMLKDISSGKVGASGQPKTVSFYRACRDLNAGSFHLVLSRYLSKAGRQSDSAKGFVMELDRGWEVWNFPVWGFKSEIGSLRPVAEDTSIPNEFRSKEATHVADVTTNVVFLAENGPYVQYEKELNPQINWPNLHADHGKKYWVRKLQYSLEFDKDGFVVGGEWTESPRATAQRFKELAPDFIWSVEGTLTDKNRKGDSSVIKYSIVKKLLDCSQRVPDRNGIQITHSTRKKDGKPVTETINAVSCDVFNNGFDEKSPIEDVGEGKSDSSN